MVGMKLSMALAVLLAAAATGFVVPGQLALSFSLEAPAELAALSANFSFSADSPPNYATFFFMLDDTDLFTTYMQKDDTSLSMFINNASSSTTARFVFLANSSAPLIDLSTRLYKIISTLPEPLQAQWRNRTFFNLAPAAATPLDATLTSWPSPHTVISFANSSVARLDCLYAWCSWPQDGDTARIVVPADPCKAGNGTGMTWIVDTDSLTKCEMDDVIASAVSSNADGIVFAEGRGAPYVRAVGAQVSAAASPGGLVITSISYTSFNEIMSAMPDHAPLAVTYATESSYGLMAALDAQGAWLQVGWEKYPYMMMLGWQAQYQAYLEALHHNLTKPAYIVPVFDHAPMHKSPGAVAMVTLDTDVIKQYNTLELDMALSCPGALDEDCPTWDHTVHLFACCADTPPSLQECNQEMGRWITPFRRRVGRWLTPVSELLPLLNASECVFNLQTVAWAESWTVSLNLRLQSSSSSSSALSVREVATEAHNLYSGERTFNASYNDGNKRTVVVPSSFSSVKLEAVITGHGSDENGCGEFCPTSHHFVINGDEYMVNFTEAGSAFGCADKAPLGAEPNEHGTWYYGRNGWCDGQDVRPWVVDISRSVPENGTLQVDYYGWYDGHTPSPQQAPGYIINWANIVVFQQTAST